MFNLFKQDKPTGEAIEGRRNDVPFAKLTVRAQDPETNLFYCSDGDEDYLAACYISHPLTGADESTVSKFKSALGMPFPAGTFIQIGLLSSPDVNEYLDDYLSNKDKGGELVGELSRQHHDFMLDGVDQPLVSRSGVLMNRQRVIVTVKMPCPNKRPTQTDLADAKEQCDRLQEGLKASGLMVDQVDVRGYLYLMRLLVNPWERPDAFYDADAPLREQVFFPSDSINFDDPTTINFHNGGHYVKAMSVKFFPKRASMALMNYMIGDPQGLSNQITDPFFMVLTIHYPDQVKKSDWVRGRSAMINHQVFGPTAHMIPALGYKKAGIDTLIHEMEGKGAILCEVNFSLFLFSRTKERIAKQASALQAYFASLAFEMREDRRILEPLWNNLLPMNTTAAGVENLFRFHTMAVSHACQFLPVIGEWRGSGRSGVMAFISRRGQPVLFDLYESSTNYNAVIFAESGGGKSFLTQKIISDYLAEGAKVWVIDQGRSYFKLARANNGEFMEFSPESNICLNPFTNIDNLEDEMDILKAMLAKMAAPEEVLDDYRMAILEQAITGVYSHYGNAATVSAVAEWCLSQSDPEAQRLGKQLFPFAGGAYTRWFEGENNLNLDNDLVVLELQDLAGRKALQQVVLLQLISRINHEVYLTHGRKKVLVIDEAWSMLDDPVMGKAMEAAYRKARKHDAAVIVVTQSVADLYNSPNARAIYQNSAWQFILQQKAEAVDAAIEGGQFKIEPYGAYMLKTVHTSRGNYSEVMIKRSENDWGIVRLAVNRFHQVMFSTTGRERDAVLDCLADGWGAVDAINEYISMENQGQQM